MSGSIAAPREQSMPAPSGTGSPVDLARSVRAALALRFARRGEPVDVELVEVEGEAALECSPRASLRGSVPAPDPVRFPVTDEPRRAQVDRVVMALESLGWIGPVASGGSDGGLEHYWCAPG